MKLYEPNIALALQKYSETHKREGDGAVYIGAMNRVHFFFLTSYLLTLGALPTSIGHLIHHPTILYQDS